MKIKSSSLILFVVLLGFSSLIWSYHVQKNTVDELSGHVNQLKNRLKEVEHQQEFAPQLVNLKEESILKNGFKVAAKKSRPSVVFIQSSARSSVTQRHSPFDLFYRYFNAPPQQTANTGSGVIATEDGYIITNHHVIRNAEVIEVSLPNHPKSYTAEVVGTDPSSDLALLKIDGNNLPHIQFANSDALEVGEWVLAVGNPFNLNSTVTAGIVSAKGRNINIVRNQFPIESFIQTDAAINPGNSGGALVDVNGDLVGINTAILSKTGSHSGYGFAIPANIVHKVMEDLINYGMVQRAFVEAEVADVEDEQLAVLQEKNISGAVNVSSIIKGGNAEKAGLQKGDLILAVDGRDVNGRSQFDEQLAYYRPGDRVNLSIRRGDKEENLKVTLVNEEGVPKLITESGVFSEHLGANLSPLSKMARNRYGIDYGIQVNKVEDGILRQMGIREGFVILSFNGIAFEGVDKFINTFERHRGRTIIRGITQEGQIKTFSGYIN